jgi:glucans biosynthesis protein
MRDGPHVKRRGWLNNGNPPGDFSTARRCGAKTRGGATCRAPGMPNGRYRLHGGASTGPRTEGLARSQRARWKHGLYSRHFREARRQARRHWFELRHAVRSLGLEKEIKTFERPALECEAAYPVLIEGGISR